MKQAIICGAFLTEKYRLNGKIRKPGETENVYYQYDDDREELIETASVEKDTTTKAYSKYLKDMKETQAFPFLHRNKFFRYMNCLPL